MGTAKEALSSAIKTLGRALRDGIVTVPSVLSQREKGRRTAKTLCDGIVTILSVLTQREKDRRTAKTLCDGIVAVPSVLSQREKGRRTAKTLCDGIVTILSVLSRRRSAGEEAEKRRSGEAEKRRRGETLHLMILVAQVLELDGGAQLVHYFHAHEEEPVGLCRTGLGA